jgi:hypothetical protein
MRDQSHASHIQDQASQRKAEEALYVCIGTTLSKRRTALVARDSESSLFATSTLQSENNAMKISGTLGFNLLRMSAGSK